MNYTAALLAVALAAPAFAALPPLFDAAPRDLAPARVVVSYPAGTFLESVLALPDGDLLVNSHLDGLIHRVTPSNGTTTPFARVPGTIAGLAPAAEGAFIVSGWLEGKQPAIFHVSATGTVKTLLPLPDAQFPNGVARLTASRYLVADSYRGVIWDIDAATPSARLWLEHPTLARPSATNPVPGVNGLKLHDGALFFSNTQASTLHRLALTPAGLPDGEPVLVAAPVNLDDFAFGPDGALYGTTHVFNNVIRINPATGAVAVIAETEVLGSTAATFGATAADAATLYVVGNGGLTLPPPEGVQPATLTAVRIGPR
jgi:sugar lactone lactonase YvrE